MEKTVSRITSEELKPIETRYGGCRFRSRLEARWAVFFDALKVIWEYEKEGYVLNGRWYLPDFWLPQVSMWAEVKPALDQFDLDLCDSLARATGHHCLLLDGVPRDTNYWSTERYPNSKARLDYFLTDPHHYHLSEHRFFSSTGEEFPDRVPEGWCHDEPSYAVVAARSARFEFGESG